MSKKPNNKLLMKKKDIYFDDSSTDSSESTFNEMSVYESKSVSDETSSDESGSVSDRMSSDESKSTSNEMSSDMSGNVSNELSIEKCDNDETYESDQFKCYYKVIDGSNTKRIKYIYHISDIHIRKLLRSGEYKQVFLTLFCKLKEADGIAEDIALIVVTGDIMNERSISNISVPLMIYFFAELGKIAPVVFVAGNHDILMGNTSELDVFSSFLPIAKDTQRVHYLIKTGAYRFRNIIFGVTNVKDNILFKASDIDKKIFKTIDIDQKYIYKVALYHGTLYKAKMDNGTLAENPKKIYLRVEDFEGYNYGLLGDIHIPQFMGEDNNIAYAGSLIQQTHGENYEHGFLKWTMGKKSAEFIIVENNYGFHEIFMSKTKISKIKKLKLSEVSYVKIHRNGESEREYLKFKNELRKAHVIDDIIEVGAVGQKLLDVNMNGINIENISSRKGQKVYIETYLSHQNFSQDDISQIVKLHECIVDKVQRNVSIDKKIPESIMNGVPFRILKVTFDNVLCYGEGNIVDSRFFSDKKIIGLIAPNQSGKSSFVDILLFCLFGQYGKKKSSTSSIMHQHKDNFHCSMKIESGNSIYLIERFGTPKEIGQSIPKISVLENGKWIPKGGTRKNEICAEIEKIVGTYTEFVATSALLYRERGSVLNMTSASKSEYFINMLQLGIFSHCRKHAAAVIRDLKRQIESKDEMMQQLLKDMDLCESQKKIEDLEKKNVFNETKISSLRENMVTVHPPDTYSELKKYNLPTVADSDKPGYDSNKIIRDAIKNLNKKISDIEKNDPDVIEKKLNKYKMQLKHLDYDYNIKSHRDNLQILNDKLCGVYGKLIPDLGNKKLDVLTIQLDTVQKNISDVEELISDTHGSDYCVDNVISKLENEIAVLNQNICHVNKKSNTALLKHKKYLESELEKYADIPSDDIQRENLRTTIEVTDSFIETYNSDIIVMRKIECSDAKSDKLISNLIKKRESWIDSYQKDRKRMNKLLNTSDDTVLKQNNMNTELCSVNENIKSNDLINIEYNANKERILTLDKLKMDLNNFKKLRDLREQVTLLEKNISDTKHNDSINKRIDSISKKIKQTNEDINNLENTHDELNNNISFYESRAGDIGVLKQHLDLMTKYKISFAEFIEKKSLNSQQNEKINVCKDKIRDCQIILQPLLINVKEATKIQTKLDKLTSQLNLYTKYKKMLDPDSLPHTMLKQYVPIIVNCANNFLNAFKAGIQIKFTLTKPVSKPRAPKKETNKSKKKNKIDIDETDSIKNNVIMIETVKYMVEGDVKPIIDDVDRASGFESFVINLAIMHAFRSISNSSRANWFIVDEGWYTLDPWNIEKISLILNGIAEQYEHVLLITHLECIKDHIQYTLDIHKDNDGFSVLCNDPAKLPKNLQKKKLLPKK
jgi:DNA repair exonuclease SbcCD ATPase subunit